MLAMIGTLLKTCKIPANRQTVTSLNTQQHYISWQAQIRKRE